MLKVYMGIFVVKKKKVRKIIDVELMVKYIYIVIDINSFMKNMGEICVDL